MDYCRFNLRIPADVLSDYYPALKNFFATLKELFERGEIPQSKRKIFLDQLADNAEQIRDALNQPFKILREKYSYRLKDLTDEELKKIYGDLSPNSFTDLPGRYNQHINELANAIKSKQLKNELLTLWQSIAGKNSPREWSKIHRTPILIMVPAPEQDTAKKVFDAVMNDSPDEKAVQFAIDYLKKRPSYFEDLNDKQWIEENFSRKIVGADHVVLDNNNEVRKELERRLTGDAYNWYPNMKLQEIVKKLTKAKYFSGGFYSKVVKLVMRMTDSDAKKLLIELVDKDYEVGLKILKES